MDYDWVFEKGYADFDSQSECEDFIRWAISEIKRLREDNKELGSTIDLMENDRIV